MTSGGFDPKVDQRGTSILGGINNSNLVAGAGKFANFDDAKTMSQADGIQGVQERNMFLGEIMGS